jgi:hypothetical protein
MIAANADASPPHTAVTVPDAGSGAWSRGDSVTIDLRATDSGGAGVREIRYVAHGAHAEEGSIGPTGTITLRNEGVTDLEIAAVDLDGNTETPQRLTIKLDRTPPSASLRGVAHYAVYEKVSIACTASDELSGIADDCAGFDAPAIGLGLGPQTITRTVTDRAGNATVVTFSYSVDLTPDVVAVGAGAIVVALAGLLVVTRSRRRAALQPAQTQPAL